MCARPASGVWAARHVLMAFSPLPTSSLTAGQALPKGRLSHALEPSSAEKAKDGQADSPGEPAGGCCGPDGGAQGRSQSRQELPGGRAEASPAVTTFPHGHSRCHHCQCGGRLWEEDSGRLERREAATGSWGLLQGQAMAPGSQLRIAGGWGEARPWRLDLPTWGTGRPEAKAGKSARGSDSRGSAHGPLPQMPAL